MPLRSADPSLSSWLSFPDPQSECTQLFKIKACGWLKLLSIFHQVHSLTLLFPLWIILLIIFHKTTPHGIFLLQLDLNLETPRSHCEWKNPSRWAAIGSANHSPCFFYCCCCLYACLRGVFETENALQFQFLFVNDSLVSHKHIP